MEQLRNIRVWVAGGVSLALWATGSGCDRRSVADQGKQAQKSREHVVVVTGDEKPPEEKDPAKLLARALLLRDSAQVTRILKQHPDIVDKPISGARPLWRACESRSLDLVKAIVEGGADINALNKKGQTALWAAISADSLEIVNYLISKGADVKKLQTEYQMTLLWPVESKQVATLLLDAGLDLNHRDTTGDTAMHQACRHAKRDVVEVYLDHKFPIEGRDGNNMTPLHSAASTCWVDARQTIPVVALLLQRGADMNARGYLGHSLLHECALYNLWEMADYLLKRDAPVDMKDDAGRTPIEVAEWAGKADRQHLINLLVNAGAKGIKTPLPR